MSDSLVVVRWSEGNGPADLEGSWSARYRGAEAGGVLLGPGEVALSSDVEQASVYDYLHGTKVGPDFPVGPSPISLVAQDVDPVRAEEWDRYYREEHFPAIMSLPGFTAGARFRLARRLKEGLHRDREWLTLYQLTEEGPQQTPEAARVLDDWIRRGKPATKNRMAGQFYPA
jgi:hypothetical protein